MSTRTKQLICVAMATSFVTLATTGFARAQDIVLVNSVTPMVVGHTVVHATDAQAICVRSHCRDTVERHVFYVGPVIQHRVADLHQCAFRCNFTRVIKRVRKQRNQ